MEETGNARDPVVRSKFKSIVLYSLRELDIKVNEPDIPDLVQKLFDDILGFGPLEEFFYDPEVTEIIVNGTTIRIQRAGKRMKTDKRFESVAQVKDVVDRMIAPTGRRFDYSEPRVNARLHDGSRLIAHLAPVSVDGITVTIRRFRTDMIAENLVQRGSLSREMLEFLKACVRARFNIVVSGGTGAGKSTVLNVLASFIPEDQSIITIEDPAELNLQHDDVRRLEARPPNIEGKGAITQRNLMTDALRMFPDRIIIGEVREAEAFEMLQAMNTGHKGSMTTVHADNAYLAVDRLITLVQLTGKELPRDTIIGMIGRVVDLFIHVTRDPDGRRRFDHIAEVAGIVKRPDGTNVDIELNMLWEFKDEEFRWVANKFFRADRLEGWKCAW